MAQLRVLHPVARTVEHHVTAAPRPGDLAGKRLGLYWNMKAGGDVALEQTGALLQKRFPGLTVKPFIGSMGHMMRHCTAEDADRIARECEAVVGTTSD